MAGSKSQTELLKKDPVKPKAKRFYPIHDFNSDWVHKDARALVAEFMKESLDLEKESERYKDCRQRTFLTECKYHADPKCQNKPGGGPAKGIFLNQVTCKSRVCEPCARSFGLQWRRKVLPYVEQLVGQSRLRRLKFITFTWKQGDFEITPGWIKKALKDVGKTIRRFFYPKTKKGKALGGAIAVLEMSATGFFHVHCLAYSYYQDVNQIREYWQELTGDSYIVDIRDAEKAGAGALDEILKYIIKPISVRCPSCGHSLKPNSPFCPHCFDRVSVDQQEIVDNICRFLAAIKGTRRIHTWGIFYNNKEIKITRVKAVCPFCGGPLKLFLDHDRDDGSFWPISKFTEFMDPGDIPKRYG